MKRSPPLAAASICLTCAYLIWPNRVSAADLPDPIKFDAGPLGQWQLSGGADGYAYGLTGTGDSENKGLLGTSTSVGLEFLNGLVTLKKPEGLVQFTFEAGAVNALVLGARPKDPALLKWSTGPVRSAYVTLQPSPNLTISAGQIGSVEGYESAVDWKNFNMLLTSLWDVENAQSVGASATYTYGPLAGTIAFGDGFDTNRWNYLQLLASYQINENNSLTLFGATNLGATGPGAGFYGNASRPYVNTTVGIAGTLNLVNSSVIGGYHTFTSGNLTLTPEVQFVWSNKNENVGLPAYSSHFGAAVFANYRFAGSPLSVGGWVQYFTSNGPETWFLNPGAQGFGLVVGPTWSPEWAKKHFFMRADAGWLHLTNIGASGSSGYGSASNGRDQATFAVQAGVLF